MPHLRLVHTKKSMGHKINKMCSTNTQRRRGDTKTPTTSSTSTSTSNNGHNTINRDKTKAAMEGEGGTNTTGKVARARRNRMYHIHTYTAHAALLSHTEVEYDLGGYSRGPRGTPWHCMSPTHFGTCCPLATAALLRAWMIFMYWLITWNDEHPPATDSVGDGKGSRSRRLGVGSSSLYYCCADWYSTVPCSRRVSCLFRCRLLSCSGALSAGYVDVDVDAYQLQTFRSRQSFRA